MSLRLQEVSPPCEAASELGDLPDPATPEGKWLVRKAIAASAIGNATEWYDYGVYATVATYLADAFFPGPLASIGTMLGFAVSFVMRPLGGMVWGAVGDRLGRKSVLAMTILLVSGATALIGVLPTYGTAGGWAPVMLICLRVVQGFSTGGEYGGAATFMAEYAPDAKRGRYGSFLEFGTLSGFVFGSAIVLVMEAALTREQMWAWGWQSHSLLRSRLAWLACSCGPGCGTARCSRSTRNKTRSRELPGIVWWTCCSTTGNRSW
jgi:MFS transporter, MHS family, proline/betaine transporter